MAPWISYARASTARPTTAWQHAENERAAGSPPAATFEDVGFSSAVPIEDRPAFSRMLEFLEATEPGTLVVRVHDASRLGRSSGLEAHAERLVREAGARDLVYSEDALAPARSNR